MKTLGAVVLVLGLVGLVFALSMDTSVSSGYGSVNNLGLMNDKQNYLIVSIGAVFLGFLMIVMDKSGPAPMRTKVQKISSAMSPNRPDSPDGMIGYIESLGVYEQNGYYCFENGKTKNLDTALMWAEAAQHRHQDS